MTQLPTEVLVNAAQLGMFQKELLKFESILKSSDNLSDEELLKECGRMCKIYLKLSDVVKEGAKKAWPETGYIFNIFEEADTREN